MNRISVVIPVFNQVQFTERCLESLLHGSSLAREVVVVDNHSSDATPRVLEKFQAQFIDAGWNFAVIANEENRGFGRACNQGIRETRGEFVAVLNNDTWLMPGWDGALLRRIEELKADMIGPFYDERPFETAEMRRRASRFVRKNHGKFTAEWVSILMFFRRASLERLAPDAAPFDERFFVTYEDTDLRERMDRMRMRYFQVADCWIWHFSKGTRESGQLPSGYEQEGLRLFTEKWGFDPRERESTRTARLKRRWRKFVRAMGGF